MFLKNPVKLYFTKEIEADPVMMGKLRQALSFEDKRVSHELSRFREYQKTHRKLEGKGGAHWFVAQYGEEYLEEKIADLAKQQNQTLLFSDSEGCYTYSGLLPYVSGLLGVPPTAAKFVLPEPCPVKWNPPQFEARWYQKKAVELMITNSSTGPSCVELATGLGKSLIIAMLLKEIGRSAVVVAPFVSIAEQLLADLKERFGKNEVGQFFGGKKQSEKKFVVAVSKSLMNCTPEDKHWNNLVLKEVLVFDECHLCPADTLSRVAVNMFEGVPYRFFLSGTVIRNDGLDLLLKGIVGEKLIEIDVRQGVEEGFLSKPRFYAFKVRSDLKYEVKNDPIKMNRAHLHGNKNIYRHAGGLIKKAVQKGRRIVVLVEQLHQFTSLKKFLPPEVKVKFAHGGVTAKNRDDITSDYHRSKPLEFVKEFDNGDFPVLVGTSCIGTGTDIRSADTIVDLVGGAAEIRIRQNVGRGTRLFPNKKDCLYIVYDVYNVPVVHRQFLRLKKVLETIHGPVVTKEV